MRSRLFPQLSRHDWLRPSVLALIAANVFPLVGVFIFHWEVFPLLLLFWFENVIIGFFHALKLICASPDDRLQWTMKLLLLPFFCFHYGVFTFVHGVFVVTLFGGGLQTGPSFPTPSMFLELIKTNQLVWPVLGLTASHGISFVHNYLMSGEFRRARIGELMMQPYGRIFVLHLTIIFGGFLMLALKSPTVGLALLVVLKIMLDLRAHLNERKKFAPPAETTPA